MSSIEEVDYNTETLVAGSIITDQVGVAADTYYMGMPLTHDGTRYVYTTDLTAVNAIWAEETRVVASNDDTGSVILWGELCRSGIFDNAGVVLTLTNVNIATMAKTGFFVKR